MTKQNGLQALADKRQRESDELMSQFVRKLIPGGLADHCKTPVLDQGVSASGTTKLPCVA